MSSCIDHKLEIKSKFKFQKKNYTIHMFRMFDLKEELHKTDKNYIYNSFSTTSKTKNESNG